MEYQNITLSLPKEILQRVKHLAVERQTSVSGLLTRTLEELVRKEDSYVRSWRRHDTLLQEGLALGTGGHVGWSRRALHER